VKVAGFPERTPSDEHYLPSPVTCAGGDGGAQVDIFCAKCKFKLYVYRKGGTGSLVKCYVERITHDFTKGDLTCPQCESVFAREATIHGRPAHKMIGGKVFQRK
jgi:hypothetical protein